MIDIFEVGTGGGSIARLGRGGALRVGPQSAGSMPGPACYGRGGAEPTVTDANLLLGRLDPDHFLGGGMALDVAAAERAMRTKVAETTGAGHDGGGGRNSAHRGDRHVLRGEGGDHRTRAGCRETSPW